MNQIAKKRFRIYHRIAFLLVIILLGSCSSVTGLSASPSQNLTETAIASTVELPVTFTPSPTAVPPIATALQIPENVVKFQTYESKSGTPLVAKSMGVLVLCSDYTIQLLHFVPELKLETIIESSNDVYCKTTSPDGKWIAYDQDSEESPTGQWLIVQSADGQQKKLPSDENWVDFGDYVWLDNQRLIFNDFKNPIQRNPGYAVVVINPFTGEHVELSSNYPELHPGINGPAGTMGFNVSDVVYDPSLNLVIFPSWGGAHNYIVLWDRRTKTTLAKVETHSQGFGQYPLWSPDATHFAVPVLNAIKGNRGVDEWYSVSREGQVEQLTHFEDYFSSSEIGFGPNWSLDGKRLAFWIELEPSPCPGPHLGIMDITTKQVINTCLPGSWQYAPPPIWSLDSRYIVIRNDDGVSSVKTTLVDVENGLAFDISSLIVDSYPIGWLHYNE
jgi:hypothetical protein